MNAFRLKHMLLWKNDTETYSKHNAESSKWINKIPIANSTDVLNIQVNENFDLLIIIEQGVIVHLKLMLEERFFMSKAVLKSLHTWIIIFSQEGPSNTVV